MNVGLISATLNPLDSAVNFGVLLLFNRSHGLVDITATIIIVIMDRMMTMLITDFLIRRINSIQFDYIVDIIYHVLPWLYQIWSITDLWSLLS